MPDPGARPEVKPTHLMTAIAVAAAAVVVAHWAEPAQESMDIGMYYQDTTWYHMSFSGRFAQTGEVGPLHFTDPLKLAVWFYPQNSELLHSIGIVALDNDFLSTLINLGWLALSLLAAWCIGRPYAVGAATLVGAAVVLDSEMLVGSQAGNAPNDIAGLFFLLARSRSSSTGPPPRAPRRSPAPSRSEQAPMAARSARGPRRRPPRPEAPSDPRPRGGRRRSALPRRARGGPRDRHQDHPAGRPGRPYDRDRRPRRAGELDAARWASGSAAC